MSATAARSDARLREVADGVFLIERAHVNCYLIVDDDGLTLVDAGLPGSWGPLLATLRALGRRPGQIAGLVLTHGHFDHVGVARRFAERGIPIWAHPGDLRLVRHPYRYAHEAARIRYPLTHPRAVPVLGRMALAGALTVRGVDASGELQDGTPVDLPGRPVPVWSPGHTDGHCGFHLPDRDVLLSGDALVTLDPYTGETGPRAVARAATADSTQALESLARLETTGARTVLPGHGEPWTDGIARAADLARAAGVA